MDLKLCSDVPIVDFVDTWTFVTIFTSRHLGPNIWVLANGSKMICQPLGHLLGPGSSHMGLGIWVFTMSNLIFMLLVLLDPEPKTQDPNCRTQDPNPKTQIPANVYAPKKISNGMRFFYLNFVLLFCNFRAHFERTPSDLSKR